MPKYDSLADQIKYFLLNGGDYHVAPDLGADVLDYPSTTSHSDSSPSPMTTTATRWCCGRRTAWLTDCWEYTPRLLFVSPEASCGKTPRPRRSSNTWCHGRISPPPT